MRFLRGGGLAVLIAASAATAQAQSDTAGLVQAAQGFYGVYMTLHPSDGIPNAAVRAKFASFISPTLDALFAQSEEAQDHYAATTKNQAPPLLEGDPFTPHFEGATAFRIGACADDARGGRCAVSLTYDDRKNKPLIWTDTVYLVRTPSGWRVDDIAYGGNWDFGNKGRLTETLKSAISDGDGFLK